jgi:TatD DNase family protein
MYFDTHCHLNFEAFDGWVKEVVDDAKKIGVNQIVVPGTDIPTSEKAIRIAERYEGVYAAVGIHPHHIFEIFQRSQKTDNKQSDKSASQKIRQSDVLNNQISDSPILLSDLSGIEKLLSHPKVVAVGEVGIDRHNYQKTKHEGYGVFEEFVKLQKIFFIEQIKLANKYKKALIIHNREAKKDVLDILADYRLLITDYRSVFHCCEPDFELLEFAKLHKMFIGVDGDITYYKQKQEWIKTVPLEMLVLETDSPFLKPRCNWMQSDASGYNQMKTRENNEPKNIPIIAEFVAKLKGITVEVVEKQTTENAEILFKISNF